MHADEARGKPRRLRLGSGLELVNHALDEWSEKHGIVPILIPPGKPIQNPYIERFTRIFRTEVRDRYAFNTLPEVRRVTEEWRQRYVTVARTRPSATYRRCPMPPKLPSTSSSADSNKRGHSNVT